MCDNKCNMPHLSVVLSFPHLKVLESMIPKPLLNYQERNCDFLTILSSQTEPRERHSCRALMSSLNKNISTIPAFVLISIQFIVRFTKGAKLQQIRII
jgi:hypothetical protein